LPIFSLAAVTFADQPSLSWANRVAVRFGIAGKAFLDSAYLRGMLGSAAFILPALNALLALVSVVINAQQNPGLVMSPPWYLFVAMISISILDAFSGLVAASIFVAISMIIGLFTGANLASFAAYIAVTLTLIGPAFLITGLRSLRRKPEGSFDYWWERLTDLFVCSFLGAWLASSIVKGLPALAGHTMPVANHVQDIALWAALIGLLRVVLEEIASRAYPKRLAWHTQVRLATPTLASKRFGIVLKFLIWCMIASAMFGFSWQIPLGTLLFLTPSIVHLVSDRFPNSTLLWKIMPTGFPGITLSLVMASASAAGLALLVGATPEMAKYSFLLMPIPLLVPGLLKEFGRHGGPNAVKPTKKNKWIYRLGGAFIYLLTLKLAGVF
jgi:hypothetical protein